MSNIGVRLAALEVIEAWQNARSTDARLGKCRGLSVIDMDDRIGRLMKALEETDEQTQQG